MKNYDHRIKKLEEAFFLSKNDLIVVIEDHFKNTISIGQESFPLNTKLEIIKRKNINLEKAMHLIIRPYKGRI